VSVPTPRETPAHGKQLSRSSDAPDDRARDGIKRDSGGKDRKPGGGLNKTGHWEQTKTKTTCPPDMLAEEQERRRINLVRFIVQNDSKRR
jgi:hypothetical protein